MTDKAAECLTYDRTPSPCGYCMQKGPILRLYKQLRCKLEGLGCVMLEIAGGRVRKRPRSKLGLFLAISINSFHFSFGERSKSHRTV